MTANVVALQSVDGFLDTSRKETEGEHFCYGESIVHGILFFFDDGETFVVVHQRNFVHDSHAYGYAELLMPEIDDVSLYVRVVLFVDHQSEGDAAILAFDHLIGGDRLACRAVVFLEESYEIMNGETLAVGVDIALAFASHDALDFSISYFDKVLRVITDEWVCEVPKVGADHTADAVGNGVVVVVEHLDDSIVLCDMVSIMGWCLVAVGCTFAAVGVDDVAAKRLLYFCTIGGWQGRASSHDMTGRESVSGVTVSVLCQQVERDGIGTDDGWVRVFYFVKDGLEYIVTYRVEGNVEAVVYFVLQFLELTVTGTIGNLHIAVAKAVTGLVPGAKLGGSVDGVGEFALVHGERFACGAAGA